MNEGYLAILIIVATIGAGIVITMYRDLIFTGAGRRSEIAAKPAEIVSSVVSGITTPKNDDEMIVCRALAQLIRGNVISETIALEFAFDVRAGSSKAYVRVKAKLKAALAELDMKN